MSQFNEWLQTLSQQGKGPVSLSPATRGQFYSFKIAYPGNVTTATLTGSVRASPNASTVLAAFTIGTPVFAGGVTEWTVSLAQGSGVGSTGILPVNAGGNGVSVFPYDFLLRLQGGSAERLFGGLFTVSGHITEPA